MQTWVLADRYGYNGTDNAGRCVTIHGEQSPGALNGCACSVWAPRTARLPLLNAVPLSVVASRGNQDLAVSEDSSRLYGTYAWVRSTIKTTVALLRHHSRSLAAVLDSPSLCVRHLIAPCVFCLQGRYRSSLAVSCWGLNRFLHHAGIVGADRWGNRGDTGGTRSLGCLGGSPIISRVAGPPWNVVSRHLRIVRRHLFNACIHVRALLRGMNRIAFSRYPGHGNDHFQASVEEQ